MGFITIEDLYGSCQVLAFENIFNNAGDILVEESTVMVEGRLSIREDKQDITIVANIISDLASYKPTGEVIRNAQKKLVLDITNLDEEHKAKLRGAIRFYKKEKNNLPVFVKQGEKISSCGSIQANEKVIKQFEEIVGKDNLII